MDSSQQSSQVKQKIVEEKPPISASDTEQIYGGVASPLNVSPPFTPNHHRSPWSTPVQTLLDQPPATLPTRLLIAGMGFCLVFGTWAWFGQIEEVGKATGKLVPKGETYKIQPLELGKISRINVKEGDSVKKGDVIAEIDTTLAQKEVERLQQSLNASHIELIQKRGLWDQLNLQGNTQTAIAKAEEKAQLSAIALAESKLDTTRQLLREQETQSSAYRGRYAQLQPLSRETTTRLKQLQEEKKANQERVERLNPLVIDGAISREMLFQAEQALRETEQKITVSQLQEVNNANEQIFQASQSLRDLESRITQNRGELAKTYQEIAQLQAELNRKRAQAAAVQLETNQRQGQLELEISQITARISENKTLLATAQSKLGDKYLKAPINGIILTLNLKNAGEVVQAAQTIAEIAPEGVPLVLAAELPNREAGFIKQGLTAQVKIDAFPYQDYGVITGKVSQISADAKPHKELGEIYQIEIVLNSNSSNPDARVMSLKPGQTATAEIIIRRRRIADVLLEPIKKLQQDGLKL
jgi:hemolysin D